MKVKTADLIGLALDWAVAQCEGFEYDTESGLLYSHEEPHFFKRYSSDWSQGGPIIEREGITLRCGLHGWDAELEEFDAISHGPTALIAAMRCFVSSKLGDEIDVPDELV